MISFAPQRNCTVELLLHKPHRLGRPFLLLTTSHHLELETPVYLWYQFCHLKQTDVLPDTGSCSCAKLLVFFRFVS